jgi:hypothetical protein
MSQKPLLDIYIHPSIRTLCHYCSLFSRCVKKNKATAQPSQSALYQLHFLPADQNQFSITHHHGRNRCVSLYFLPPLPANYLCPHDTPEPPATTLSLRPNCQLKRHSPLFQLLSCSDQNLELTAAPVSPASMSAGPRGWPPVQIWASLVWPSWAKI